MSSANFQMNSTLGQSSPLMDSDDPPVSENFTLNPGFWYTIDIVLSEVKTVTMNIPEGWSMISLPVLPDIASVQEVFPGAVVVYEYEQGAGYVRVENEEELEAGSGYWILLNTGKSYELTGQSIPEYTLSVDEDGWHMIGGCTYEAQASIDSGTIGVIYSYIQGLGYQRVTESENLMPNEGYWILLSDIIGLAQLNVEKVENP